MLILISCAKTMSEKYATVKTPFVTTPLFQKEANEHIGQMLQFSVGELQEMLGVNEKIATENYLHYRDFHSPTAHTIPALLHYTGIVFKCISSADFSDMDFEYAQEHLSICSFGYGLLRPLDAIHAYRLEGKISYPDLQEASLFKYWQKLLTDVLIQRTKECGGILCNLASKEMQDLFDWKRVNEEVRIITPEFYTLKQGKLKSIVIYTKMNRGEMTRFLIKNQIDDPEEMKQYAWEGFRFNAVLSDAAHTVFTNE